MTASALFAAAITLVSEGQAARICSTAALNPFILVVMSVTGVDRGSVDAQVK